MSKIGATGYDEVWLATGADSDKVGDFKHNNKAELCYSHYGDSVALRGTVEITTDEAKRKQMWQEWMTDHFPAGATDPDYTLLRFRGSEATFWIDREFEHKIIRKHD